MKYKNDFKICHFVRILMKGFLLKMLFWKRVCTAVICIFIFTCWQFTWSVYCFYRLIVSFSPNEILFLKYLITTHTYTSSLNGVKYNIHISIALLCCLSQLELPKVLFIRTKCRWFKYHASAAFIIWMR